MATIADDIRAWNDQHIKGNSAITRNEAAYNGTQEALSALLAMPWAATALPEAPEPKNQQTAAGGASKDL